jgi:hypothetical protein
METIATAAGAHKLRKKKITKSILHKNTYLHVIELLLEVKLASGNSKMIQSVVSHRIQVRVINVKSHCGQILKSSKVHSRVDRKSHVIGGSAKPQLKLAIKQWKQRRLK